MTKRGLARSAVWVFAMLATPAVAQPTPTTIAALPPERVGDRGAVTSFVSYEAEDGRTDGEVIGPSRALGEIAAEASGRRAVRLAPGQSLSLVLAEAADGLTLRYAVPDAPDCRDGDGAVTLSIEGAPVASAALTPCFSWLYGAYPFTNDASAGGGHKAFAHVRLRLPRSADAGARLTITPSGGQGWTVLDVIDAERIPSPRSPPPDAVSVLAHGADPGGERSSLAAFQAALDAGASSGRPVWAPPGRYRIDGHLLVDEVTLEGAGVWHTELIGDGVGLRGHDAEDGGTHDVRLSHFAILAQVMDRDDRAPLNGVGGALSDSVISDLWIQHTKVGVWVDGPMANLRLINLRILDQMADGVNFHGGVTGSSVENSFVRGAADDGLAMWSHPTPNRDNALIRNTVIAPTLANGVAIYGGEDIRLSGNLSADSLTRGGGLHLGARFDATPFGGAITVEDTLLVRAGSIDPAWKFGVGALWLYALDQPIDDAAIQVRGLDIIDPTGPALLTLGERIEGVTIEGVALEEAPNLLDARGPGAMRLATGLGAVTLYDPEFVVTPP
ncbi:glycosyl hydrolase family 28-related protein [Brevundimonas sp.]|uniref:glycosyl hydrolase family 28-related protein n=1 Tax=Brevundimonas sp. TaxID=1871086 RepID=UPI0035B193B4